MADTAPDADIRDALAGHTAREEDREHYDLLVEWFDREARVRGELTGE